MSSAAASTAEANAIISASRRDMIGATLYLTGVEAQTGDYIGGTTPCNDVPAPDYQRRYCQGGLQAPEGCLFPSPMSGTGFLTTTRSRRFFSAAGRADAITVRGLRPPDYFYCMSVRYRLLIEPSSAGEWVLWKRERGASGDRHDGRLLRTVDPMYKIAPFIMRTKNDANNAYFDTVEISEIERFIKKKRAEGYPGLGMLHVFIASYVRVVSQKPRAEPVYFRSEALRPESYRHHSDGKKGDVHKVGAKRASRSGSTLMIQSPTFTKRSTPRSIK